jgi:hypothetical protein
MQLNHMLSLSCYKLACHYFSHTCSVIYVPTLAIFPVLLLCFAAQKMSSLMKNYFRCAGLLSSACGTMVSFPLLSPFRLVIRFDVLNTGYTVYFTIYHLMCET